MNLERTVVEVEAPEYVYPDENFQGKRTEIEPVDEAAEIQTAENNYYDLINQKLNLDEEG